MGLIKLLTFVLIVLFIVALLWSFSPSFFESPDYKTLRKVHNFEIREYNKNLVVMSSQEGSRETSLRIGFSNLARYIGGLSKEKTKISMTVPVIQEKTIGNKTWKTLFFVPKKFSLSNVPKPLNVNVKIKDFPKTQYAIIKFNGSPKNKLLNEKTKMLEDWIKDIGVEYDMNKIRYAFYHGPMTPGFLRKNEIHIPIKRKTN